jgi:hypothetical protein
MPKAKLNSQTISMAELGIDKLRAIDPNLDLGNNLTLKSLVTTLEETRQAIAAYNTATADLEKTSRLMQEQEKQLASLLRRTILGVGAKFGERSEEYNVVKKLWKLTRRSNPTTSSAPSSVGNASQPAPEAA